jgi:hypothetical protein
MERAKLRGLLAFSAVLALGSTSGWAKASLPDRPLHPGSLERVSGKDGRSASDPRGAEPSEGVEKAGSEVKNKENAPLQPARRPAGQEAEEEAPAREEKNDCDDCVIVRPEGSGEPPEKTAGSSGMAGSGHLAGTLWGLFMVARPKRRPRTIIRGVTVP